MNNSTEIWNRIFTVKVGTKVRIKKEVILRREIPTAPDEKGFSCSKISARAIGTITLVEKYGGEYIVYFGKPIYYTLAMQREEFEVVAE